MIEGFAREMAEDQMLAAILYAHKGVVTVIDAVEQLRVVAGLGPKKLPPAVEPAKAIAAVKQRYYDEFTKRKQTSGKAERAASIKELKQQAFKEMCPEEGKGEFTPEEASSAT